jgi:hypothetical protein
VASRDRWRLLVNFVYCPPVGHVIEALHYCHGYYRANPQVTIAVALNARSPIELAGLCPFIEATYPVSLDVFDPQAPIGGLEAIPPGWDWVADDARGRQGQQRAVFPGIAAYYDRAGERFATSGAQIGTAGATPPAYSPAGQFRLAVPGPARARASELIEASGGSRRWPLIAVLPAGSGPRSDYPSLRSWKLLLSAFAARWAGAGFCLLGKLRADTRTSTSFPAAELDQLRALPGVVDVVDRDLAGQLAVVAACDVLVSPHTGFAMAGLAVGTPWLAISGNRWPEYYFNGVPFYSVLPDTRRYPAFHQFGPDPEQVDDDGSRSPSMSYQRITEDLEQILDGAGRLIEGRWPFQTAMADYVARMLAIRDGRADLLWSIDAVHTRYLPGTTNTATIS